MDVKIEKLKSQFKKVCFKCLLKISMETLDLSSSGIVVHSLCAATADAFSPYVFNRALGVARRCWEEDLNVC